MSDVKIISQDNGADKNSVTMAEINRLAFESISTSVYPSIREDFGLKVTKLVASKKPQS